MKLLPFKIKHKKTPQTFNFGTYQNVVDSVPLLSAKFEHLLPVGLLALIFCQTVQFQYFCCDEFLTHNVKKTRHQCVKGIVLHMNLFKCKELYYST